MHIKFLFVLIALLQTKQGQASLVHGDHWFKPSLLVLGLCTARQAKKGPAGTQTLLLGTVRCAIVSAELWFCLV